MIKLVAIDVDDTLIDHQLQIPPANKRAINKVRSLGITVMLATGRMHVSAMPYAAELGFDSQEVILSYNGAMLRRINGELIRHTAVESDLALAVIRFCQQHGYTVNLYYDDQLYVDQINDHVDYYMKMAGVDATPVGDLTRFVMDGKKALSKLLIVGWEQEIGERIELVRSEFGAIAQITRSKPRYIEITHPKASKGLTLASYAAGLGLVREEVLAIGDSGNDLTMLEWAGTGVAMGNADDALKQAADYVTLTNEEAGVAEALHHFILEPHVAKLH